jgi:hypothetical protein
LVQIDGHQVRCHAVDRMLNEAKMAGTTIDTATMSQRIRERIAQKSPALTASG